MKHIWRICIAAMIAVTIGLIGTAFAADISSGTLNSDISWVLDNDGVLTVSGEGEIPYMDSYPWQVYIARKVVLSEGITSF